MRSDLRRDFRGPWGHSSRATRILLVGIVVLGVAGGGVLATHTSLFAARTIRIHGASHLSDSRVISLADVHLGTNVFYLDAAAVRARLVADPWVASATVVRSLPSTIDITIQEVRPVGMTASADAPLLLAQDGTVLGPAPAGTRLPVIGIAGQGSAGDAAGVLGALPPPLLARVGTAVVAVDGRITLTLRDGVSVMFGNALDAGRKAEALRAVLAWTRSQPIGVVSIDVSSPAVPTARLRGTTVATAIAPPTQSPSSPTPSP